MNIIPHVEEMWDVQDRDRYCEVGTSQRPNCWKDDDDDDEDEKMMAMKHLYVQIVSK